MNHVQVLGTHNSYHWPPDAAILSALGTLGGMGSLVGSGQGSAGLLGSNMPDAWAYEHAPLARQLEAGIRAFELDLWNDPKGGAYKAAAGLKGVGKNGTLPDPRWSDPGIKVLHVPDVDYNSSCVTLQACLGEMRAWSDANPDHTPVTVFLELADQGKTLLKALEGLSGAQALLFRGFTAQLRIGPGEPRGLTQAVPWPQETGLQDLASEVERGMGMDKLLTPDDVIEHSGSIQEAVRVSADGGCGWPSMNASLNKFMFVVMRTPASENMRQAYAAAHPGLAGATLFLQGRPGPDPVANEVGFMVMGDGVLMQGGVGALRDAQKADEAAKQLADTIEDLVAAGYLVRSRTDANLAEAKANYTGRRDAVIRAGAHFVVSDATGGARLPPGYESFKVELDSVDQGVRCNPVTGADVCT